MDATTPDRTPADETVPDADRAGLRATLARYDALTAGTEPLSPPAHAELIAMAGIFDLDTSGPAEAVWARLRAVLAAQSPREPDDGAASADALSLLIVEDDPQTAQDLTALLVEAGHAVIGPFHSAEAAEVVSALHAIDVALLDINLSGAVDGATLGRRLKSRWGTRIVFLSGDVTVAARHADIAEAMVIKPYRGADVLDALRRAFASA